MPLPIGQISLNEIHQEAGGSSGTYCTINDSDIRGLIGKSSGAESHFYEWWGASNEFAITISSNTQELDLTSTYMTSAGWNQSSDITLTISSGVYIWSDDTSTAALTVASSLAYDLSQAGASLTIVNNGYIMGKGGHGGYYDYRITPNPADGEDGGPAISGIGSNLYLTNNSGAYVAGGGGGGAANWNDGKYGGGGGGAGGGNGGGTVFNNGATTGGAIGQEGADAPGGSYGDGGTLTTAYGGGAGGGGGAYDYTGSDKVSQAGGAGGRKLGSGATGGSGGTASGGPNGGAGGSNGNDAATVSGGSTGGGGGWGANGADSYNYSGGSGGAAISGGTWTVTNNGTIYGTY